MMVIRSAINFVLLCSSAPVLQSKSGSPAVTGAREHRSTLLSDHFRNDSRSHRMPAFSDGKAYSLFHGDRGDQFGIKLHIVPRHYHLYPGLKCYIACNVTSPEVELWTVPLKEG